MSTPWFKAKASGGDGGGCVEMRGLDNGDVEVRDTKAHGQGPILRFTPTEFAAWVDGAKNGEFDHIL